MSEVNRLISPEILAREMERACRQPSILAALFPQEPVPPLPWHRRLALRLRGYGWRVHDAWLVLIGRAEIRDEYDE